MPDVTENAALGTPKSATQLLDHYYLHMRSALLETAAGLDRIERAPGGAQAMADPRIERLREACAILGSAEPDRARRFQLLLSVE